MELFRNISGFSSMILVVILMSIMISHCKAQENDCFGAVLQKLSSGNQADLLSMVVGTGKGLNDLGEYDLCINNPETTYATVSVFPLPVYLGVCLPSVCNSQNTMIVEAALTQMIQKEGIPGQGKIDFPDSEPPKVQAGNWVGFFSFGFLILL